MLYNIVLISSIQQHKSAKIIYIYEIFHIYIYEIPGGSNGKECACSAVDPGLIPRSGRSSGEGNGFSLQ